MADGDGGGGAGSGWSSHRPELYHQGRRALNPTPLATALSAPYPAVNGSESTSTRPLHRGPWHSVPPPMAGPSPSPSFSVSIPPVYFAHPPPMPPMEFPSLIKLDIPVGSGVVGVMAMPSLHGAPPRSNLSSGMNEVGVSSSGDRTPANAINPTVSMPSTSDQHAAPAPAPDSSISPPPDLLSLDPSASFTDPLPVPEDFPRDPVPQGGRGEGWPYAPQGWPNPDDKWGWRVGKRASASSLWIDRYITVPVSLTKGRRVASKIEFASRKSLVEYLKQTFPQMKDPYSIFKAFDWKVPAPKNFEVTEKSRPSIKRDKPSPTEGGGGGGGGGASEQKGKKQCQAGNPHCHLTRAKSESLACHICCAEPSFCRDCKCILCCKFFSPDAEDFTIIRCLNSPTSGQGICGHAAHLECALDSQLAGVIKKINLDMEYICRRCDRKTDLKETVGRLVSEFMSKTASESKVESSLQLLLRVVQDPEEEAHNSGKLQATLLGALKKVQEGADLVESCKELTEQLHELRSGQGVHDSHVSQQVPNWYHSGIPRVDRRVSPDIGHLAGRSRAMGRKREWEDSLHPSETGSDKRVPQAKSVGSPDTRIDAMIVTQGDGVGVATTSGTRVEPNLKDLPSTSLQDNVLSTTRSQTPCELVTPRLSSLLDQSVCQPPTLSIEEHIRQCEAMANRVKGAGQLTTSPSILPFPGTLEVVLNSDSKPPSVPAGALTVEFHERLVVPEAEASHNAEELVTSTHSSSRAKSPSSLSSRDAAEDHVANTEDDEACIHNACGAIKTIEGSTRAMEDGNKSAEDAGGDDTASTMIVEVSKPPTAKGLRFTNSQDAGEDDVAMAEPMPAIPSFDPALESEFEEQISEALQKLRRAQAAEYARAEEALNAQKKVVIEQYRQLESVCGQFAEKESAHLFPPKFKKNHKPRAEFDRARNRLMAQYGKAQEGQKVFESMLAISNGFGQVSKEFLQEFFQWPPSA